LAADEAAGWKSRTVRAYGPGEILAKKNIKRGRGRNGSPRSLAEICNAAFSYHVLLKLKNMD
jgi:hypothetical protein